MKTNKTKSEIPSGHLYADNEVDSQMARELLDENKIPYEETRFEATPQGYNLPFLNARMGQFIGLENIRRYVNYEAFNRNINE